MWLWAAAMSSDAAAFGDLVDMYTRELHQEAEDGVQETRLPAWRQLAAFEGRSSFRTWCSEPDTLRRLDIDNALLNYRFRPVDGRRSTLAREVDGGMSAVSTVVPDGQVDRIARLSINS